MFQIAVAGGGAKFAKPENGGPDRDRFTFADLCRLYFAIASRTTSLRYTLLHSA